MPGLGNYENQDPDALAFRCTGFNALIAATFFNTQPSGLFEAARDQQVVLSLF